MQPTASGAMQVFNHHLYEYSKGLRSLVLQTCHREMEYQIVGKLEQRRISYLIYPLGTELINVFFGNPTCLEVIRRIGKLDLSAYTPEEDFILGIMLGYERRRQCDRYLKLRYDCSLASE